MLKEMNKKLLENEQKLADFFTAKEVVGRKRQHAASEDLTDNKDAEPVPTKKIKTWDETNIWKWNRFLFFQISNYFT